MILFLCPYCHNRTVPAPPDTPNPHAACETCGQHPRAKITYTENGTRLVKYVKDGRKPTGQAMVKINVRIPQAQAQHFAGRYSQAVRRGLWLVAREETPGMASTAREDGVR